MPITYEEALAYLDGFVNYERQPAGASKRGALDLSRVRQLARALGDPQLKYPTLHIAGTKGKGSACAFAASILSAAGLKVGLYTSPHLEDVRERIVEGGAKISRQAFAMLLDLCMPYLEELRTRPEGTRRPTYFEIMTHMAFLYFAARKVDVAVIEVGMGGRLDATNLVEPDVCGITNISFDHQAVLGSTLELIATEKAGILKRDVPCVVAPQIQAVTETLEGRARWAGAKLEFVGRDLNLAVVPRKAEDDDAPLKGCIAALRAPDGWEARAELGLVGRHQAENWAVAVRMAELFHVKRKGGPLPEAAIAKGSKDVVWPGRLEEVKRVSKPKESPRVFLDGAHNDYSIDTVLTELHGLLPGRKRIVVLFACAKDKDAAAILKKLAAHTDAVVFTHSGNKRSHEPEELAKLWKKQTGNDAPVRKDLADALGKADREAGPGGIVLATGSLYLVGALKSLVSKRPAPK
ncbi:MAG: bifunctional folylpolyglutamate synthase/dihydrofolate synthase [Planctomycetes bacterium]|nr:bifunctional folylpolyglutamate synthase/dihydrofolate synthase [Planctomycetota bacterium]